MNRIDLDGRRAVVTGGAQGIGRAIAERLLASGAAVTLWDRDPEELGSTREALGAGTGGAVVDVADPESVERAAAATIGEAGGIDILVNNAGIAGPNATTWEYPVDEWRQVIDIDLNAVFYCCRAVVPHMIERGYGRIVNIASIAGKEGNPNAAHYSASKAGVITFTRALGKEVAGTGVLVNCITPAVIETPILGQVTDAQVQYMVERIPLGRMGRPEEVAALIAWLSSEECSFSTAAAFDLSGGRTTY